MLHFRIFVFFCSLPNPYDVDQAPSTWGTCIPRGIFAYVKGYIYYISATIYVMLRHKNGINLNLYKNVEVLLKVKWIFVILLSLFVIRNFMGMCSSVKILKGYMVRERLGTPDLDHIRTT